MVVGIQADRIERVARRLDPDLAFDLCGAQRVQRQREYERFGNRLDGEGDFGIADLIDMSVEGGEADAEMIGGGLAEFRDVVGDGAARVRGKIPVTIAEEPQQRRL